MRSNWRDLIPPSVTCAIARRVALYAGSCERNLSLEPADDFPGAFRISYRFDVDRAFGDLFFNSPSGLRGHYYRSPEMGDEFTRRCLTACAPIIKAKWRQQHAVLIQRFAQRQPSQSDLVRGLDQQAWQRWLDTTLEGGKLWYVETNPRGPRLVDTHWARHEPDFRWTPTQYDSRMNRVAQRISLNDAHSAHQQSAHSAHQRRELDSVRQSQARCKGWGQFAYDVSRVSIKGRFVSPKTGHVQVPLEKRHRGDIIHHLGFS